MTQMTFSQPYTAKYISQMIFAFLAALFTANALCYFYYSPAIQTENPERYTDCKSEPSAHNPHGNEGYGTAIIDKNGFNNVVSFPFREAEILCIGSSQTEAQHINWDQNYVYQINLHSPNAKAYNLGVSGQKFSSAFYRIPALRESFPACRALVFEMNAIPSEKELVAMRDYMASGEIPTRNLSWKKGNPLVRLIGRIPLCRLLWSQYDGMRRNSSHAAKLNTTRISSDYESLATEVLSLAKQQAGDVPILIFNLPRMKLRPDGTVSIMADWGESAAFKSGCKTCQIHFIDMGLPFTQAYEQYRTLPYGFLNSHVGSGHLNVYGHKIIADTLYEELTKDGLAQ